MDLPMLRRKSYSWRKEGDPESKIRSSSIFIYGIKVMLLDSIIDRVSIRTIPQSKSALKSSIDRVLASVDIAVCLVGREMCGYQAITIGIFDNRPLCLDVIDIDIPMDGCLRIVTDHVHRSEEPPLPRDIHL